MTQLPVLVNVTVEPFAPDTAHAPGVLEESTLNTTGLPDRPPVAVSAAEPP